MLFGSRGPTCDDYAETVASFSSQSLWNINMHDYLVYEMKYQMMTKIQAYIHNGNIEAGQGSRFEGPHFFAKG